MEGKQVLWRRNCFEIKEISSEWEAQAEVSQLSWGECVAAD